MYCVIFVVFTVRLGSERFGISNNRIQYNKNMRYKIMLIQYKKSVATFI